MFRDSMNILLVKVDDGTTRLQIEKVVHSPHRTLSLSLCVCVPQAREHGVNNSNAEINFQRLLTYKVTRITSVLLFDHFFSACIVVCSS